ncbi:hypothetical protein H2198_007818 [Neophaeococcomyces mojaviensis]|uniref:Uncharacterized protein n=1 Tax=Neophaeococcomyces mojaviensis TaxID=3383035 RepID=A0ACC2ZZF9_9EURO|nr:hypothetical protein H2198_007818 [Knufia sp. JES_112]
MTDLHEALKHLGPVNWSDIPTSEQGLNTYLTALFSKAQVILDSVPIPSPGDAPQQPQVHPHGHASKASEVSLSAERSAPPPFGHEKFQKEWGKAMKMKAQENALGLSLYKMSSKDGRGSWFARHSVHEGIGFSKFKKSLQMEFEKSLAEQGPPGTGNVRGIGGEERVEQIKTPLATVEVYRLSAQFPGPTAARDFVTLLITSDKAMKVDEQNTKDSAGPLRPRHYMIISRPCDHPKTQPRNGFVRGSYESVEFIREVPRKLKASQSSIDLSNQPQHPADSHVGRHRAATAGQSHKVDNSNQQEPYDPEDNPVEWLMITRSDPGGGIPRFLVERGTPSSICADAVKFVDWACSNDEELPQSQSEGNLNAPEPTRRGSHQSWRSRSLVGVVESEQAQLHGEDTQPTAPTTLPDQTQAGSTTEQHDGMFGTVSDAAASLKPYTPQVILNHLPGTNAEMDTSEQRQVAPENQARPSISHNDNKSFVSTTSFASAEDHWSSSSSDDHNGEATSLESLAINSPTQSKEHLHHEKEMQKLNHRKQALHEKFAVTQSKYDEARSRQAEKDSELSSKASEKHERELKKHEEKFQKELRKIEQKQEKERRKLAHRQRKQIEKDEKAKLTRERDEARKELDIIKKEAESLKKIVAELQKENTSLVIKLGKAGLVIGDTETGSRSRGSSLSRSLKEKKEKNVEGTNSDLAVASAAASLKSQASTKS